MKQASPILCVLALLVLSSPARAQQEASPLPSSVGMDAITTRSTDADAMLTTHDAKPEQPSAAPAVGQYSPKIPFGRAEPAAPIVPAGPRATVAVPVVDVDTLDAPEAAPPAPVEQGADPVQENPTEPTELTSPIFEAEAGPMGLRSVVIRALNKVTAQSEMITLKANQMVTFGQLQITAITCQTSAPRSQTDYAALLDIVEKLPTGDGTKPVFRGWMYASSPSVTALEHPVYDVTMVECKTMPKGDKENKPADGKDVKEAPKPKDKSPETNDKKPAAKPKR